MSYLQEIIMPGEVVRYTGKLHWIIYLRGILAIAAFSLAFLAVQASSDAYPPFTPILLRTGVGLGILLLLDAFARQAATEIVITDRRAVCKYGFFSRTTTEMNMDKIESVDVSQSALGRVLGFGTVILRGTGTGISHIRHVANPIALRKAVTAS